VGGQGERGNFPIAEKADMLEKVSDI